MMADIGCPLAKVPSQLEGRDWTRYEGVLHTDHAVREEFFVDRAVAPTSTRPYLMDFTYLYDERQADFGQFTGGEAIAIERVHAEIGRPEEWTHRAAGAITRRSEGEAREVAQQLEVCKGWAAEFGPGEDE